MFQCNTDIATTNQPLVRTFLVLRGRRPTLLQDHSCKGHPNWRLRVDPNSIIKGSFSVGQMLMFSQVVWSIQRRQQTHPFQILVTEMIINLSGPQMTRSVLVDRHQLLSQILGRFQVLQVSREKRHSVGDTVLAHPRSKFSFAT